jgi:tetratricopeptide (TPR) repeat protein
MKKISLALVLVLILTTLLNYNISNRHEVRSSLFSQMLYLPSGKYLKPASFGYYGLLSDFIYLWSIQYYSDPGFHPRLEYLKHTYEIITELDPQFVDAYQTGALFMFYEGRNPKAGLELLDKGLNKNPREWILPTDAAYYCLINLKDRVLAAKYFETASKVPGAPTLVKRMLANLNFRKGDKQHALELWQEVYDTAERPSIKQTAFQHIHNLRVLIDLEKLHEAIGLYHQKYQTFPPRLEELVDSSILTNIPLDPEGDPYVYDPRIGKVRYSKELDVYKRYQEG